MPTSSVPRSRAAACISCRAGGSTGRAPEDGAHLLRISLARPSDAVDRAARSLVAMLSHPDLAETSTDPDG